MDIFDLCDNEIKIENIERETIATELKQLNQKAKGYQQFFLNAVSQNKNIVNELTNLKNRESVKQLIVQNNQILISEIEINLKVAQEKYEALVKEKDIQFHNKSKEISELADINATVATKLMNQLGLKVKLNYEENYTWAIKFIFNNNEEITLNYNIIESTFSLDSMSPPSTRFHELKDFLNSTQDISGFLYTAYKCCYKSKQ